ncbi:MAG: hypothetical protein COW48_08795 [Hydrogenophilales bacterium CG17_big_fil_post_rev_8_21_14_2_50_63_12]|nr:MAG: hypothetical protein COW48_08795 [Hydrogenophilales bacterium CG17_big_fil_post_rev_8_21_14_2_50_63_12]PIX95927.1 MAG: hypothetical protein COZ24_13030 [Hydrogenophilales bacterium CG_4_10_14_3_um_filter_63_21]PJB03244.1 MAG: hypothetical protein CO126_07765 [Hydrogenophilales bacterium CG_4_9_14_3_um_filter_63_34]
MWQLGDVIVAAGARLLAVDTMLKHLGVDEDEVAAAIAANLDLLLRIGVATQTAVIGDGRFCFLSAPRRDGIDGSGDRGVRERGKR